MADRTASASPAPKAALQQYGTVPNLDSAVELAGPEGVRLTEMSRHLGQREQLVFAPDTRTVIWASQQADGQWLTEELSAERALMQVRPRHRREAPHEYRLLLRATLDGRPDVLPTQLDEQIDDLQERLAHLRALRDELLSVG
ncbi:hypothetical protein [Kitasatospora sp. NBC_01302]|uniref:hypothetical protein n=1 Tax=Kitasatospora sp. NBC_01302 TaxID=2903575 RepID=UPI002E0FDDC1|nr:hypothetical protein OG294_24590 [Kitasatospora sp. NBC_01302]